MPVVGAGWALGNSGGAFGGRLFTHPVRYVLCSSWLFFSLELESSLSLAADPPARRLQDEWEQRGESVLNGGDTQEEW